MKDGYFKVKYYLCLLLVVIYAAGAMFFVHLYGCLQYKFKQSMAQEPIYTTVNTTALIEAGYIDGFTASSDAMWNKIMYPGPVIEPIDIDTAIEYLAKARYSHQQYLAHPEPDIRIITGNMTSEFMTEHHQGCVDRYTAVINLLESLRCK